MVVTGPIRQKRAASGYELLKGDDDLETRGPKRDGSVEELKCSRVGAVVVGRLCQTPRRLTEWSQRALSDIDGQAGGRASGNE